MTHFTENVKSILNNNRKKQDFNCVRKPVADPELYRRRRGFPRIFRRNA